MSFSRRFYAGSVTPDDTGFWTDIANVTGAPDAAVGVSQCHSTPHAVESATLSNFGVAFGGPVRVTGVAFGARWASTDPCTLDRGCFQLDDGVGAYNPIGAGSVSLLPALTDFSFGGDGVLMQQLADPTVETVYDQAYWEAGAFTLTVTARTAALLQHASLDSAWIDLYYYPVGDDYDMDNYYAGQNGSWASLGGEVVAVSAGVASNLCPNAPVTARMALITVRNNPVRITGDGVAPSVLTSRGLDYSPGARPYEFPMNGFELKNKLKGIAIGSAAELYVEYWGVA